MEKTYTWWSGEIRNKIGTLNETINSINQQDSIVATIKKQNSAQQGSNVTTIKKQSDKILQQMIENSNEADKKINSHMRDINKRLEELTIVRGFDEKKLINDKLVKLLIDLTHVNKFVNKKIMADKKLITMYCNTETLNYKDGDKQKIELVKKCLDTGVGLDIWGANIDSRITGVLLAIENTHKKLGIDDPKCLDIISIYRSNKQPWVIKDIKQYYGPAPTAQQGDKYKSITASNIGPAPTRAQQKNYGTNTNVMSGSASTNNKDKLLRGPQDNKKPKQLRNTKEPKDRQNPKKIDTKTATTTMTKKKVGLKK